MLGFLRLKVQGSNLAHFKAVSTNGYCSKLLPFQNTMYAPTYIMTHKMLYFNLNQIYQILLGHKYRYIYISKLLGSFFWKKIIQDMQYSVIFKSKKAIATCVSGKIQ